MVVIFEKVKNELKIIVRCQYPNIQSYFANKACMKPNLPILITTLTSILILTTYLAYNSTQRNPTKNIITTHQNSLDLDCGLSTHFMEYLTKNKYDGYNFNRTDLKCGAYGGKNSTKDLIKNVPVIFIHGNSDIAFGRGTTDGYEVWQTGFRSLATFLGTKGYQKWELYTTTWGPGTANTAQDNYHSKQYILRLRAFVEAVLNYTGAPKVHIIGHSMGVTLGRKIIKGGTATDHNVSSSYDVGPSLKSRVKSFIGLAGANYGLTACWAGSAYPTCNSQDGFYPGATAFSNPSTFLNNLNTGGGGQGDNVYTIWSQYDDLIGQECVVWGKITCRIPGQVAQVQKNSKEWTHFAVRDGTGPDLYNWL